MRQRHSTDSSLYKMDLVSLLQMVHFEVLILVTRGNESRINMKTMLQTQSKIPITQEVSCLEMSDKKQFAAKMEGYHWPEEGYAFMCQEEMKNPCVTAGHQIYFITSGNFRIALFTPVPDYGIIGLWPDDKTSKMRDEVTLRDCSGAPMDCRDVRNCTAQIRRAGKEKHILRGMHFQVASNELEPYMSLKRNQEGKIVSSSGIEAAMLQTLAEYYQFTFEQIHLTDNQTGVKRNGRWTGILGMVNRKEVDFGLSGILRNYVREEAVRFSLPVVFTEIVFVVSYPKTGHLTLGFLYVFPYEIWLLELFCMLFVALTIRVRVKKVTLLDIIFKLYANLLGRDFNLRGWEGDLYVRSTLSFWLLFALLTNAIVSGIITSMVIPVNEPVIDTLEKLQDAVANGAIDVGTTVGSAYHQLFSESNSGLYFNLGSTVRNEPKKAIVITVPEGLHRVLAQPYAFVFSALTLDIEMHKIGRSKFYVSSDEFFTTVTAFALQKDCWYVDAFDRVIQRITETGLTQIWTRKALFSEIRVHDTVQTKEATIMPLSVADLQSPFYVLIIGLSFAVLVLMAEIVFVWKINR